MLSPALVEMSLNQAVLLYRQQGYDVSWSKKKSFLGRSVTYTITSNGQGWQQLEALLSGNVMPEAPLELNQVSITELEDGRVRFVVNLPDDPLGLNYLMPSTVRLRGSHISDHNAHEIRGGTATWIGPAGTIQATVTPLSPFNQGIWFVVGGAVGAERFFEGAIDGVAVFRRALSPREVLNRFVWGQSQLEAYHSE